MKHPLWDTLPRWLLAWLVCVALNLGLAEFLRVESRWWLAALVLLLWCAVLAVTERFGRFWAMLALWAVAFGLCLLLSDREQLAEAALAAVSRTGEGNEYSELALLLLCASAVLPLFALLQHFWMRAALSLAWGALWIAASLLEWPLPRLIPVVLIPLMLLTLAEAIRRLRGEAELDKRLRRALLLSLLPTALLLALLPVRAEPYDYPLLHSVVETVERLWRDMETSLHYRHEGDREFGMSFNGFSGDGEVGEGADEDSASAIYVKPAHTPGGAVYFFGNAWDHFDGRNWGSTLRSGDAEYLNWSMDTAEHLYAFWRMQRAEGASEEFSDYFRANSVYLSCRNTNVRTMFTVMNATHLFTDTDRFPYADGTTGSLFDYVQKDEVWYRVHFLEANTRTQGRLIAFAEGTRYDEEAHVPRWYHVAEDLPPSLRMDLKESINLEKAFAEREKLIRSVYLDCSEVSGRAAALAEEITAGCGSDYEKVNAIAAYLRGGYSYSLSPAPVPKGENFLDWLLFEGREGYCTWYATAAVLLARSSGVPARYVQGYRSELTGDVFNLLKPGDAHAWCECYIAGYGWVTVDATPGFGGEGPGWMTAAERQAQQDGETEPADTPEEELFTGGSGVSEEGLPSLSVQDSHDAPPTAPAREQEQEPEQARFRWMPALISGVLLAVLAGVWLCLRWRRKLRYAKADPSGRLMMDLEQLMRDLRGKGYSRRPEEPLRAFFERVPWRYLLSRRDEAEEMAALYDRTFFGLVPPSEEELARHRDFAARLRPRNLQQWLLWLRMQ